MNLPIILKTQWPYFARLLQYQGFEITPTCARPTRWGGDQYKIKGFDQYNFLLDINSCFSTRPSGDVRDRTGSVILPFKIASNGHWQTPTSDWDLETCFYQRVKDIESIHTTVNLLWSGGIDSTAMLVAWLKFADSATKIRVMYSIDSIKENAGLFLELQKDHRIELVEIGGRVFLEQQFDGAQVTGGAGDDLTASVDESFFAKHGWHTLDSPWKDFFWKQRPHQSFMDFCEQWFACAGRPIQTVLEARWWFYINKMLPPGQPCSILAKPGSKWVSFFNCARFESHFFHRINKLFHTREWKSYKQGMKDFVYSYYPDQNFRLNKCKENSTGFTVFRNKADLLLGRDFVMCLTDGTQIRTGNLPLFSEKEYRQCFGSSLDYLFSK